MFLTWKKFDYSPALCIKEDKIERSRKMILTKETNKKKMGTQAFDPSNEESNEERRNRVLGRFLAIRV